MVKGPLLLHADNFTDFIMIFMINVFQMKPTNILTLLVLLLMIRHILMMKISKVNVINISDWNGEDYEMENRKRRK